MKTREFQDVASFCLHLATIQAAVVKAEHSALERIARIVEKDAKGRIGEYQEAAGPFPQWAPLADSTEYEKARLGYPSDAPLLRKGDLRDSIRHEVDGKEAIVGSKSDIAEYQEFGTKTIPPRPFIGPAAFANKDKIESILGHAVVAGLTGGSVIHESLGYDFKV